MRHRNRLNKLGLKASHRKAMIRNMVTSFFKYEEIETTKAKAKVVQRVAEKMITRAKVDSVHNRRVIDKDIKDAEVLNKLFKVIAPLFVDRKGGYSRILKLGFRQGDAAEMVQLSLVEKSVKPDEKEAKKKAEKPAKEKKEVVSEGKVQETSPASEAQEVKAEPVSEVQAE